MAAIKCKIPQHFGLASRCHYRPRDLSEDSGEHCCSSASDRMIKIDALHSTETGNPDVAFANERFGDVTKRALGRRELREEARAAKHETAIQAHSKQPGPLKLLHLMRCVIQKKKPDFILLI